MGLGWGDLRTHGLKCCKKQKKDLEGEASELKPEGWESVMQGNHCGRREGDRGASKHGSSQELTELSLPVCDGCGAGRWGRRGR